MTGERLADTLKCAVVHGGQSPEQGEGVLADFAQGPRGQLREAAWRHTDIFGARQAVHSGWHGGRCHGGRSCAADARSDGWRKGRRQRRRKAAARRSAAGEEVAAAADAARRSARTRRMLRVRRTAPAGGLPEDEAGPAQAAARRVAAATAEVAEEPGRKPAMQEVRPMCPSVGQLPSGRRGGLAG